MQAYIAKLSGTLTTGDCVRLTWYGSTGGRNDAGHHVRAGDSVKDVLNGIFESAKNYFLSDQEAKVREDGASMMIITSRTDGWFGTDIVGAGTEVFTIEKL